MNELTIKSLLSTIVIAIFVFLFRKTRKAVSKDLFQNLELHDSINSQTSIWDEHPQKAFYHYGRVVFYTALATFGCFKAYWIFVEPVELNYYFPVLGFTCLMFFILLIVRCLRCKTSLFLQEMNTFTLKSPKVCIKCGYPSKKELPKEKSHTTIRPVYKWAIFIFAVLPFILIFLYFGFQKLMEVMK
ncbi:MAG: hypothetical protein VXV96_14660 [Bdellovibrionota bacterium]|nr:hypothetical protein [Bdellovibrionota bacterium]